MLVIDCIFAASLLCLSCSKLRRNVLFVNNIFIYIGAVQYVSLKLNGRTLWRSRTIPFKNYLTFASRLAMYFLFIYQNFKDKILTPFLIKYIYRNESNPIGRYLTQRSPPSLELLCHFNLSEHLNCSELQKLSVNAQC